jgi:hypothetical protein
LVTSFSRSCLKNWPSFNNNKGCVKGYDFFFDKCFSGFFWSLKLVKILGFEIELWKLEVDLLWFGLSWGFFGEVFLGI